MPLLAKLILDWLFCPLNKILSSSVEFILTWLLTYNEPITSNNSFGASVPTPIFPSDLKVVFISVPDLIFISRPVALTILLVVESTEIFKNPL